MNISMKHLMSAPRFPPGRSVLAPAGAKLRARLLPVLVAGAVICQHGGGLAQTNDAPAKAPEPQNKGSEPKPSEPKQVGPWTVAGWSTDNGTSYCAAERSLPGAAGRGASLQFGLLRSRTGYWLGLGSVDWELKPNTTFRVEVIANPVLRSDANAIVLATKSAAIELGSDRQLMQKLATVPSIEVKTAKTTFKLPVDAFSQAVAELDACFGKVNQPSNPFTAPDAAPRKAPTAPRTPAQNPPPPANNPPPASASTGASQDTELAEERTVLTVRNKQGSYRLEALVVRPAKANGHLPIALITHGKNDKADENQHLRADLMLPQARDLAMRGWLAVVVMRRGYGGSDGLPGVSRGAAHMSCESGDLAGGFDVEADDLDAALKAIAARPDADGSRAIAIGQSLGGGVVLALAARQPAGLLGVVNVSGGAWRSNGEGVCDHDALVAAMATLGARTRIVSLWLYAQNDSLFPPPLVNRMRDAYAKAGGRADLRMFPPVLYDGHNLFSDFNGRGNWLLALDGFLQAQLLPNANAARADRLIRAAKAPANGKRLVENYLSAPMPKTLVVSSGGAMHWAARPDDADNARKAALARCREKSGSDCSVAMENNDLVLPAANDTNAANATTR